METKRRLGHWHRSIVGAGGALQAVGGNGDATALALPSAPLAVSIAAGAPSAVTAPILAASTAATGGPYLLTPLGASSHCVRLLQHNYGRW